MGSKKISSGWPIYWGTQYHTTRIYTMDSGYQHMVKLEQIQKILAT